MYDSYGQMWLVAMGQASWHYAGWNDLHGDSSEHIPALHKLKAPSQNKSDAADVDGHGTRRSSFTKHYVTAGFICIDGMSRICQLYRSRCTDGHGLCDWSPDSIVGCLVTSRPMV